MAKKSEPKKEKTRSVISENTKLTLTIPWKNVAAEYDKVLGKSARKIKVKGFRKGNVPKKIAEEQLGRDRLVDQVLQTVVPPLYEALIKQENKQPLTNPEFKAVSLDWGNDWVMDVFIAEKPEIKLGDYKKVIKEANKKGLAEFKKAQEEHAKLPDHKDHDHSHDDPKAQEREMRLHQIFKALVESVSPQIPELLLKEETKQELNRLAHELEHINLTLDNYLERRGQTFEQLSQELAAQTLGQLQLALTLEAVEKAENITASDEDKKKELESVKDEKLRKQMAEDPRYKDYLEQQLRRRNLLNWMIAQ